MQIAGETCGLNTQEIFSVVRRGIRTGDINSFDPCNICKQEECSCRGTKEPYVPLKCEVFQLDATLMQCILSH